MLREGMTCARSHTQKWHLQDFNQVCLPRADVPAGSCIKAAVGLGHADSVACSSVLSPYARDLAAGRSITPCSPSAWGWPPGR